MSQLLELLGGILLLRISLYSKGIEQLLHPSQLWYISKRGLFSLFEGCVTGIKFGGFNVRQGINTFVETRVTRVESKLECSAFCTIQTGHLQCTAFFYKDVVGTMVCHCGKLSPFVTGPKIKWDIFVSTNCKQVAVSGIHQLHNVYAVYTV